jgi:uncharacterized membrane protein
MVKLTAQSEAVRDAKQPARGRNAGGDKNGEAALDAAPKAKPTRLNRLALWITLRVGTMQFFLVIFTWTASWLLWNMFAPKGLRFDPYPGFVLWLFVSNMIQLFLMPLIMIGQNLQGRGAEERAKNDYKVNQKAEREIELIQAQLAKILERLEDGQSLSKIKPGSESETAKT